MVFLEAGLWFQFFDFVLKKFDFGVELILLQESIKTKDRHLLIRKLMLFYIWDWQVELVG